MNKKIKNGLGDFLALVVAFSVGFVPVYAADVHIFRNPSTLVPVGASVDDTGKFQGDGSALTGLSAGHADGANCAAGQFPLGVDADGAVQSCSTALSGNADTSTALSANGTNCTANQFNKGVDASGNAESCATLLDADVPDGITITGLSGTNTGDQTITLTGDVTGSGTGSFAATVAAGVITTGKLGADAVTNVKILNDTIGAEKINFNYAGSSSEGGAATTASALAANPTDCSANQFAQSIVANGNLTCAAIADADVPDSITVTLAGTATALAANGSNCSAGQFAAGVDASGASEGCTDVLTESEATSGYQPLDTNLTELSTHYEGKFAQASICTKVPAAAGNFITQSNSPYQMWTATGTAIGQWIGMMNGLGPC